MTIQKQQHYLEVLKEITKNCDMKTQTSVEKLFKQSFAIETELYPGYKDYYKETIEKVTKYAKHIDDDRKLVESEGGTWIAWGHELLIEPSIQGYLNWKASKYLIDERNI